MEGEACQELDLAQATTMLLEECRMILPGIQAIFGFQLIAVFNERFARDLSHGLQLVHLGALCLVALDVYVIACLVFAGPHWAGALAAVVIAAMAFLWFAFPHMGALHRVLLKN